MEEKITLIVPVYNEFYSIEKNFQVIANYINSKNNWQCIIVDDGSNDGTEKIISKINLPKFKVLTKKNGGYGSAIMFALKEVVTDYFAIIDADSTYPIYEFNNMEKQINEFHLIIGSRTKKNAAIPLIKKIPKFFIKKFMNYITDMNILDFNSGMRIMKTDIVKNSKYIIPDGFSFTTTTTLIFSSLKKNISFYQIDYYKRDGHSKIRPFRDTANFFLVIFKMGIFFKPFKVFGPFILFFFLMGFFLLLYRFFIGEGFLVFTILCFIVALLTLFFSMISLGLSNLIKNKYE
jgi:glycosyltransferase involved in cell wall biosynthesis